MSSEHPERQTGTPADGPAQALSIPRWAATVALLIVLLPVLIMWSMMLVMGWFGPPMYAGMAGFGPGVFLVVGTATLLLVLAVIYGVYRHFDADKE